MTEKFITKEFDFSIEKSKDKNDRRIKGIASIQIKDNSNDIVRIDGIKLTNFRKNPVFVWAHRGNESPENVLGTVPKIKKVGNKLEAEFEFVAEDINPRADLVCKLYKAGVLKGFSIGASINFEKMEWNKKRKGYDYNEVSLFEISACAIPANPSTLVTSKELTKALEDGVIEQKDVDLFNEILKEFEVDKETDNLVDEVVEKQEKDDKLTRVIESMKDLCNKIDKLQEGLETLTNNKLKEATGVQETPASYIDDVFDGVLDELDQESDVSSDDNQTEGDVDKIINEITEDL